MTKNKIGPGTYLYPLPCVLIGAEVNGKANFMTVAWASVVEQKPPIIYITAARSHYTNKGIKENQSFSVNIPSEDMVEPLDYCGTYSGKKNDKSKIFDVFYGSLKTAPMIKEAPINLECKVVKTIDTEWSHEVFFGQVVEAYADDNYLTNGTLDMKKINPIMYSLKMYWKVGEKIGPAWNIGKNYRKE